ncbi:hypothetical protein AYO40_03745 [Planctomycetaceae bacterium SCGC AG-212-D15]|nr:hypothetical protein AYO40_03745 [Planctomycetaceae bacterium SCGC AG-212-D15]
MKLMTRAVAVLALIVACGQARADLIVNGSFEAPPLPIILGLGGAQNFNAPGGSIPNWTIGVPSGSEATLHANAAPPLPIVSTPYGNQWMELNFGSSISQSGINLTPGQLYRLTFAMSSESLTPPQATVNVDITQALPGGGVFTDSSVASLQFSSWSTQTFDFIAVGTDATLTFTALIGSDGITPIDVGLDNVSLNAVPQPASWSLLGIGGALGLALCGWRRKSLNPCIAG